MSWAPAWLAGVCLGLLLVLAAVAQPTSESPLAPPRDGMRKADPTWHALVNATVHVEPGRTLEGATVVLRDGRIVAVHSPDRRGRMSRPPAGARVHDMDGLHIYAAFIDPYVDVDAPVADDNAPGRHWSRRVVPERSAAEGAGSDGSTRRALRELGFGAAGASPQSGIFRGRAAAVSLAEPSGDPSDPRPLVYREDVYNSMAFERTGARSNEYPASHMGAVALMRQTLTDADWLRDLRNSRHEVPDEVRGVNALDHLADASRPLFIRATHELHALHAADLGEEFDRPVVVLGNGMEFRRLAAISEIGERLGGDRFGLVVPLRFPNKPDLSSPGLAASVSLEDLMTWEQAPTNVARLDDAGLRVALTSDRLNRRGQFHARLRRAIEHGLSKERALAMLTTNPAEMLGVGDQLGRVEQGYTANLLVTDGDVFEEGTTIRDVWIDGHRHEINPAPPLDLEGVWDASARLDGERISFTLEIDARRRVTVGVDAVEEGEDRTTARASSVSLDENRLSFALRMPALLGESFTGVFRGVVDGDRMHGSASSPNETLFWWTAQRRDEKAEDEDDPEEEDEPSTHHFAETYGYPFGPYAIDEMPEPQRVRFVNATIWTAGPDGVIEDGELRIADGRIEYVGQARGGRAPSGYETIDLKGRHITPGIVDAHSHTGLFSFGVNEGTNSVTAEVRIADAVDPGHINWYRQLAAGVTTVNSLHGSSNSIGGQNLIQKVRWGARHPRDMHFDGAPKGIKFALGENVKQSNWGDRFRTRYPQTRMGVETIIRDALTRAAEYRQKQREHRRRGGPPPRRDLRLEALAEILDGDRLVHSHCYRQDEILMLARVARDFDFRIGTFQHVLEGYKVADAIKDSAIGASAFSDWWAFKVEAYDAIPHAGPIMHEAGVNVSYNSDSDELARRMNIEAAKAVRYGNNMDPHEALKFVTINPAIQLGIEDRVGSLERGKDADFVIWSGEPLSTLSRAEATWIDGAEYFSLERDREHRETIARERARLFERILHGDEDEENETDAADSPDAEQNDPPELSRRRALLARMYEDKINRGIDPTAQCADCGCTFIHDMHAELADELSR